MGIKFGQSVTAWFRENGLLPASDEPGAETIESDTESEKLDIGCVDLDTKVQQLLAQFKPDETVPLFQLSHRFELLLSRVWKCRIQIATFDPRGPSLSVPRLEVAIDRKRRDKSAQVQSVPPDYETVSAINPHQADAADKFGFRTFLAKSLAARRNGHKFVVIAPNDEIYGDKQLVELLDGITEYTEGDTRIPAALLAMRRAGKLKDDSRVGLWTNDTDSLWMPASVGPLAEFCLYRPNFGGKKEVVIDLMKLKRLVEKKFGCNYISWLFWVCLFRGTDYTTPPPGFCSIGNSVPPPTTDNLIRLDAQAKSLSVNRRQLRALLFRAKKRNQDAQLVLKHLDRMVWSAAFYLLLKPDPKDFGWTSQPFVFEPTGILKLEDSIESDESGWIDLFFV